MLIFISQRASRNRYGASIDSLESSYIQFFDNIAPTSNQPVIIPVPNSRVNVQKLLSQFCPDLFVLSGGNNVPPGECDPISPIDDLAPERDTTEKQLITFALENKVPMLGICRGFQFINSYFGGKITYNLKNHPDGQAHTCIFQNKHYLVNSFHHHGIHRQDLAEKLKPLASTTDGEIIEAFASKPECATKILGVQWHPERKNGSKDLFQKLFSRFIGT